MKTYKAAEIIRAVGLPYDTLARWTDRGLIPVGAAGKGHAREYRLSHVCEIAIMNALVKLGVAPAIAAKYAAAFSKPQHGRPQSKVFAVNGTTYLVINDDGARVVHKQADEDNTDLLSKSAIILNLSVIIGLLDFQLSKTHQ